MDGGGKKPQKIAQNSTFIAFRTGTSVPVPLFVPYRRKICQSPYEFGYLENFESMNLVPVLPYKNPRWWTYLWISYRYFPTLNPGGDSIYESWTSKSLVVKNLDIIVIFRSIMVKIMYGGENWLMVVNSGLWRWKMITDGADTLKQCMVVKINSWWWKVVYGGEKWLMMVQIL